MTSTRLKLRNYTSNVPVERTVANIERSLALAGVACVTKEYGTRADVAALCFTVRVGDAKMSVRLPVNSRQATKLLFEDALRRSKGRMRRKQEDFFEQGLRTAWKIMQDWVEVQLSLIQMGQADVREVFLPYIWDGRQTLFASLVEGRQLDRLLIADKTS